MLEFQPRRMQEVSFQLQRAFAAIRSPDDMRSSVQEIAHYRMPQRLQVYPYLVACGRSQSLPRPA